MAKGICFKSHAGHRAVMSLFVLEATLVLLTAQVPVLRRNSSKVHTFVEGAVAVSKSFSSKLCWSFVPSQIFTAQGTLQKVKLEDNYQLEWSEVVPEKVKMRSCR